MEKKPKRSYYVDWLRVLAVLALFPFHAGQIFNEAAFYVKDNVSSPVIMVLCDFIYQWHMPLFMFLAGIGSYYALRFQVRQGIFARKVKAALYPTDFRNIGVNSAGNIFQNVWRSK